MIRPACAALIVLVLASTGAAAASLELKRVMLSSGGVGYFEYQARVTGDDALSLDVRLDQVDDILKSLVVYDDKGTVVSVALQSREPLSQILRDLPFDAGALDSPKGLINALRGAELKVGNPRPMTGRVLKAEDEVTQIRDGVTTTRTRVSLMTASGLQQFVLEDADAVAFVDPALQAKLADALAAVARYHDGGRRTLVVRTGGKEARTVRLGYVVGAPLWKASYRLTFAADPAADKARLQGWAVLENATATDWRDVELTLLSGNPVTFRQKLYESYYADRPEVPVEVVGRILPKTDEGSVTVFGGAPPDALRQLQRDRGMAPAPPPAPAAAPTLRSQELAPAMAQVTAASTIDSATHVSFTLPTPVSIAAGQSAAVPLIDRALPATRLSVSESFVSPNRALASFELTNDTDSGLPPGVLTLYETASGGATAYVGDARLSTFPAGEQRLLSYAVDDKLKIDHTTTDVNTIVGATVAEGVMKISRKQQQTLAYLLAAPAREPRRVILEVPRVGGWTITAPDPAAVRMTPGTWRVPTALEPGAEKTLIIVLERPLQETVRILDLDDARLGVLVSARELPAKLRDALTELQKRRQALAEQRTQQQRLQGERDALAQDQARVRENLNAVQKGTPIHNRLIDKLGQQETRLEQLATSIAAASEAIDKATGSLADYVKSLTL
ncbi:MAG: DUF4139 domain-containing protein [Alphaproteobacteria bacterium]|nr:DUF4139 domain-containing protein [Alphaproteobacteria bacterium]